MSMKVNCSRCGGDRFIEVGGFDGIYEVNCPECNAIQTRYGWFKTLIIKLLEKIIQYIKQI